MSAPGFVSTKSAASTATSTVNSSPRLPTASAAPTLPALHLAAQTGDLTALYALLSPEPPNTVTATVHDRDPQNITALHWAAINNQVLSCKFLLEQGAEVDARGGELNATPLHWAARNGHLYIVHLLLKYSADPTLLDSQSFNTLHLAVHSSSALLLAYILFTSQPIAVDSTDTEGHTSLHWACYQGDSISVDLLLRAGADPRRADEAGLTPLHWAAVKGNAPCIKRLIEAGVDISAREKLGKTAKDMAVELKSGAAYKRGLLEAGFDEEGRRKGGTLSPKKTIIAIFIIPTIAFFLILNTLAVLPWWSGLLLATAIFFGMHHVVSRVLLDITGEHNVDRLMKSPYLCAIICASIVWNVYVWVTRFVHISGYAVTNLLFAVAILTSSYNFFRAVSLDPGHVPFPANDGELKDMIEDLVEVGSFSAMNFCLTCMTRRPLRSKHSHVSKRCTARFDHQCPWIWNDVGVNNHRQFLLFVATLVIAIILFVRLSIGYFSERAPSLPSDYSCSLPISICTAANFDTFALSMTIWSALQLTWTTILLGAQFWQICRQMTTLEVSNVGRYGFMGGRAGGSSGLIERESTSTTDEGATGPSTTKSPKSKSTNFLLKILGIDRFTSGKAAEGLLATSTVVANPFDLGCYLNVLDFFKRGREVGVDYTRLYEVPEGGFARARRERRRREREEKEGRNEGLAGAGARKKMTVGGAAAYERVAMDDV